MKHKKFAHFIERFTALFHTKTHKKYLDIESPSREELTEIQSPWWGNAIVAEDQSHFWKIENYVLCVDHHQQEWRFSEQHHAEQPLQYTKFIAKNMTQEILVRPCLPNRPLVLQLHEPLYLQPHTDTLLYFSLPVWIRIEFPRLMQDLAEFILTPLSDTWWGPNTYSGQLCYAHATQPTTQVESMPPSQTQAYCPIFLNNQTSKPVFLQHLYLPLSFLTLYESAHHDLWTEQLNIYPSNLSQMPELFITQGAPKLPYPLHKLTPARVIR
jgi:hypothetical protein